MYKIPGSIFEETGVVSESNFGRLPAQILGKLFEGIHEAILEEMHRRCLKGILQIIHCETHKNSRGTLSKNIYGIFSNEIRGGIYLEIMHLGFSDRISE